MARPRYQQPPRIKDGVQRIVDLSHEVFPYPRKPVEFPPPPYTHLESFGEINNDVTQRTKIFRHLQLNPYSYSNSTNHTGMLIHQTTANYTLHVEGPHPGFLRPYMYDNTFPPDRKLVPKQASDVPLAQLIGPAAILDLQVQREREMIPLDKIKALGDQIQEGDMVFIRTGQRSNSQWSYSEPGTTKWLVENKGCLIYGTDSGGIDEPAGAAGNERNHEDLMLNGGCALEPGLHWERIPGNRAFMIVLPLRIHGLDAGIGRAIAILGDKKDRHNREAIDVTPTLVDTVTGKTRFSPPFKQIEPIFDKNNITRRLEILPFSMDNAYTDQAMYVTFDCRLGTHIEVPNIANNSEEMDVASIQAKKLLGDAVVLDIRKGARQVITAKDLANEDPGIRPGDIVLLRTDYSNWYYGRPDFYELSPWLSLDAASWLVDKQVAMLGTDTACVDAQEPSRGIGPDDAVSSLLLSNDIPIVQNLTNLRYVRQQRCFFVAFPLKIRGLTICPVRAAVLEWYE